MNVMIQQNNDFILELPEILEFIKKNNNKYGGRLRSKLNYTRNVSMAHFAECEKLFNLQKDGKITIAVV